MICDSCIHKEVCYEKEEDRRALKQCSDYFNFEEELEKIKTEISEYRNNINAGNDEFHVGRLFGCDEAVEIINNHITELKGENGQGNCSDNSCYDAIKLITENIKDMNERLRIEGDIDA